MEIWIRSTSLRSGELLEGVRAMEEQLAVDGGAAKARVELVEVAAAERQVVGEKIGERHDLSGRVLGERGGDRGAAVAAAQQAETNGGVGLVAEGGARLKKEQAASGSGLHKLTAVHASHFLDYVFEINLLLANVFDLLRARSFALNADGAGVTETMKLGEDLAESHQSFADRNLFAKLVRVGGPAAIFGMHVRTCGPRMSIASTGLALP